MTVLALLFCAAICAIAVACLVMPSRLVDIMQRYSGRMLYYAAAFRIMFGVVLVLAAPASRAPQFIWTLGLIVIVAGIVVLFVGRRRFGNMMDWLAERGPAFVRFWGLLGLVLGLGLGYLLMP